MRLWSLHPKYLDAMGLVALWREGLLARKVLLGLTKGYRHHPQLLRFSEKRNPVQCLDFYLSAVLNEARSRGYKFNGRKIGRIFKRSRINVSNGQLQYELDHLGKKLRKRDLQKFKALARISRPEQNPIFRVVRGNIEKWEKARL